MQLSCVRTQLSETSIDSSNALSRLSDDRSALSNVPTELSNDNSGLRRRNIELSHALSALLNRTNRIVRCLISTVKRLISTVRHQISIVRRLITTVKRYHRTVKRLITIVKYPIVHDRRCSHEAPERTRSLRRLEFRAVWNSAPFGIPRRLEFRAVWNSAPFGIQRRLDSAPFGIQRLAPWQPFSFRTPNACVRKIDAAYCSAARPLDARDQRIRAATPVDDSLRKVVLRIGERDDRVADAGRDEIGRRLAGRFGMIDDARATIRQTELLVRRAQCRHGQFATCRSSCRRAVPSTVRRRRDCRSSAANTRRSTRVVVPGIRLALRFEAISGDDHQRQHAAAKNSRHPRGGRREEGRGRDQARGRRFIRLVRTRTRRPGLR